MAGSTVKASVTVEFEHLMSECIGAEACVLLTHKKILYVCFRALCEIRNQSFAKLRVCKVGSVVASSFDYITS